METPNDSFIIDLAARTTVKDYGDIRFVTIPNCSTLSNSVRTAVGIAAQQRLLTPEYTDALTLRLQGMTPPLDEEEERQESRILESEARKELEEDGCPPCYEPDLDISLRNVSEEIPLVARNWQSLAGIEDVVLCVQLSDWRKFRAFQQNVRRYYKDRHFSEYVSKAHERRRRHQLCGHINFRLDCEQQTRLENWTEFQGYHLQRLERFAEKTRELMKQFEEVQKVVKNSNAASSKRAAEDLERIRQDLEFAELNLERRKILLLWIEQERERMDSATAIYASRNKSDDEDNAPKDVRKVPSHERRKRRPAASRVLGDVRVSKAKPKKRKSQTQDFRAINFNSFANVSDKIPPTDIRQAPKRLSQPTKKETPVIRSQRLSGGHRVASAYANQKARVKSSEAGRRDLQIKYE